MDGVTHKWLKVCVQVADVIGAAALAVKLGLQLPDLLGGALHSLEALLRELSRLLDGPDFRPSGPGG